jgi:integrase
MARAANRLTAKAVEKLKEPGMHNDGNGLYLRVADTGSRSWLFRYKIGGKPRAMGLGAFPAVSLAEARSEAQKARDRIKTGVDPIEARHAVQAIRKAPTFRQMADEVLAARAGQWRNPKSGAAWELTLLEYAAPLHGKPVDAIDTQAVLEILKPHWTERPETANRLRQRIEIVLDRATALGHIPHDRLNPARWQKHLSRLLPKREAVQHHAAMPYARVPEFYAELMEQNGPAALCLRFIILTAVRSNEARGALWDEIDGDIWTVPGDRTKTGKPHRVPLSSASLGVLTVASELRRDELIFPSVRAALSDMAFAALCRRMKVEERFGSFTTHGMRSAFRDWVREETDYPFEVAELALAHSVGSAVMRAYARGDMLEKRRALMQQWADFCYAKIA